MSCPLSFLTTSARFSLLPCLCVLFRFALVCFVFCFAVVGRLFLSEGEKQRQRSTFLVSLLSLFLRCRRLLGCLAREGAEGTAAAVDVDVCGWFVKNKAERKVGTRKPQGTKKKTAKSTNERRGKSQRKKNKKRAVDQNRSAAASIVASFFLMRGRDQRRSGASHEEGREVLREDHVRETE